MVFVSHGDSLLAGTLSWELLWKFAGTHAVSALMVAYVGFGDSQN